MRHFLLLSRYEYQEFIRELVMKTDKEATLDELWTRLSSYWNFLNFDLLEHVISNFAGEDLKREMKSYKHDLQLFRNSIRLCDFIDYLPVSKEPSPEMNFKRLSVALKWDWNSCTLEDLDKLEGFLSRILNLPKFALLIDIKHEGGNTFITRLIPLLNFERVSDARGGVVITQTT